eukprot:1955029-Heterocapsa_arctica.AAC.1
MARPSPAKRPRLSNAKTTLAVRSLADQQLCQFVKSQMEYVWAGMQEDPSIIPALIGVLDHKSKNHEWFPDCCRKFGAVSLKHTIVILENLQPELLTHVWPVRHHKEPGSTKDLLLWALGMDPEEPIPKAKREKADFLAWAAARYAAVGSRLKGWDGQFDSGAWKFKIGSYNLVMPEAGQDITTVVHTASQTKVELTDVKITEGSLCDWEMEKNFSDMEGTLHNIETGCRIAMCKRFKQVAAPNTEVPYYHKPYKNIVYYNII